MQMNIGILFILGIGVFGGMLGARVFQKLRIPQVVGYIAMGLILGQSGFKVITSSDIEALKPFNLFALGIIGFLVGGELMMSVFKKYAKQFIAILLGEGLGAFVIVGAGTAMLMHIVTGSFPIALAAGIVFGAIASATDPASTIDVLWEYRARGVLTTSITAIVALDDALAMSLYGLGTSAAAILTSANGSIAKEAWKISFELLGAMALGFAFALVFHFLLRWFHQKEKALAMSIGLILLLIWICASNGMDVILGTMTLGFALTNMSPRRSKELFKIMREFSIPIYALFFVLIGSRLGVSNMPAWLWGIVALYVVGRSAGKIGGSWLGGWASGSPEVVKRYLGIGILAQGGVAVGLSIMAAQGLSGIMIDEGLSLGDAIIFAVTATTLIVQIIGPPLVKLSIKFAGEAGRNITEEDVVAELKAVDVSLRDMRNIEENLSLSEIMKIFSQYDYLVYPVVDKNDKLLGLISLNNIKNLLSDRESWQWIVAADLMEPVNEKEIIQTDCPLREALDYMQDVNMEQLPIVDKNDRHRPAGLLDMVHIRKRIQEEILKRQSPSVA